MEAATTDSLLRCEKIGIECRLTAREKLDSKDSHAISDLAAAAAAPAAPHPCHSRRGSGPLFYLYLCPNPVGHTVPCEAEMGANQGALRYRGHVPKEFAAITQASHHTTFTARCCSSGSVRYVPTLLSRPCCIPPPWEHVAQSMLYEVNTMKAAVKLTFLEKRFPT